MISECEIQRGQFSYRLPNALERDRVVINTLSGNFSCYPEELFYLLSRFLFLFLSSLLMNYMNSSNVSFFSFIFRLGCTRVSEFTELYIAGQHAGVFGHSMYRNLVDKAQPKYFLLISIRMGTGIDLKIIFKKIVFS